MRTKWWTRRDSAITAVNVRTRSGWPADARTLADDLRENPRPVDTTPHEHFHAHGGTRHSHTHVHPNDHAHSARADAVHVPCSECGDLLDAGECATHGVLDPFEGREGQPEFNGAFR